MHKIQEALRLVYAKPSAWIVSISVGMVVLFIYYIIFLQTTTWTRFFDTDIPLYVWSQIILSIANAAFIGIAVSLFLAVWEIKQKAGQATLLTAGSLLFSAAATGCPVCGAFLLPLLGVSASLAALPLGGLEIKFLSLGVLTYAIYEYAKTLTGGAACSVSKDKLFTFQKGKPVFHFSQATMCEKKPLWILLLFILAVYSLPFLPKEWRINFQKMAVPLQTTQAALAPQMNAADIQQAINPTDGYTLPATYGTLGPHLLQMGAINLNKFKAVFAAYKEPLTSEEIAILTEGSDQKIRITAENAHFLLDLFWAVGLSNASPLLTQGDMVKYGQGQIGSFASTGNWVIGDKDAMNYYAKGNLISLSSEQEARVEKVAAQIYRPCCANSAAFPDCNHGMAMLGLLELMASSNATEDQMYNSAKYLNAFWFPQEYFQLATYFKQTQGKDFKDVDAKLLLSKDYSSVFGIQHIQEWMKENFPTLPTPLDKVGCGV